MFFVTQFFGTDTNSAKLAPTQINSAQELSTATKAQADSSAKAHYLNCGLWGATHNEAGSQHFTAAILEYGSSASQSAVEAKASALPYRCYSLATQDGFALVFPFEGKVFWRTYTRHIAILAQLVDCKGLRAGNDGRANSGKPNALINPSQLPRVKQLNEDDYIPSDFIDNHRAYTKLLDDYVVGKRFVEKGTAKQPETPFFTGNVAKAKTSLDDWFEADGTGHIEMTNHKPKKLSTKRVTPNHTLEQFFEVVRDNVRTIDSALNNIDDAMNELGDKANG